jgi:putative aldouronate transport system substrate-binding protein
MKRTISLISFFLILLSCISLFTSCKSSGGTNTQEGDYGRYKEEVKFTTVRETVTNPNFPEGMSAAKNPYWDIIKEELNVTAEFLWETTAYDEKLMLDITAGTIPDIFIVNSYQMYQQLYLSDMIEDLTDVYEKNASKRMKDMYSSYGDRIFTYVTENDRLMALPGTANGYQHELLWVRKDWLDALGLQPPKTLEEIAAVAKAFVEQDPGGNGKGKTLGLVINREHCFQGYRNSYGLEPVACALGAFPKQWMMDKNGKVYYGSIQPEFKQTLALVRSWIEKGIISTDLFTQGWETIWGSVTDGLAGMWFFPWNWALDAEFKKKNPRAEVICYNAPIDANGKVTYFTGQPFENMLVVRKGYEHPEVVFKIWELYADIESGKHKKGYEACKPLRDANTTWYVAAPLGKYACRFDDTIPTGAEKLQKWLDTGEVPEDVTDVTLEMWNKVKSWRDNQDTPENWGLYTSRLVASLITKDPICNPVNPVYFYQTKTMLDIWDYLHSMENDTIRTILTGEVDIEYFDTFVADWKEGGGDTIIEEIQAIVDEKMKKS